MSSWPPVSDALWDYLAIALGVLIFALGIRGVVLSRTFPDARDRNYRLALGLLNIAGGTGVALSVYGVASVGAAFIFGCIFGRLPAVVLFERAFRRSHSKRRA